jgi:hypothetical protein
MCKNESCEFNKKCYRYINNYQHISKSKDSKIFEIKDFDTDITKVHLDFNNVKEFNPSSLDRDYLPMCFGPLT